MKRERSERERERERERKERQGKGKECTEEGDGWKELETKVLW